VTEQLQAIHPLLPQLLVMLTTWGTMYGVRRWLPGIWSRCVAWGPTGKALSHAWQALPSAVAGAVAGAAIGGGDVVQAAHGALAGLLAPALHHAAKAAPGLPYRGALGK
jgi:hypothetical protein